MLARGTKGEHVKQLQFNLMKLGYNPGSCSGFYDIRTEEAVMLFQMEHGLAINGIIDYNTENSINQLLKKLTCRC